MTENQTAVEPSVPTAVPPLPQFRCHKVVQAARIAGIQVFGTHVDLILDPGDGRDQFVHGVSHLWGSKHQPLVGGYLVRYEDGYESYSPPAAFEKGYAKLEHRPGCPEHIEADLRRRFFFARPRDQQAIRNHERVSTLTFELARELAAMCPAGRNLSLALTALEDVRMRANAAIAVDDPRPPLEAQQA